MYNYSYNVTYRTSKKQDEDNAYRKDLLNVFNMEKYIHDDIMEKILKLYKKLKNNQQLQTLLKFVSSNNRLPFNPDPDISFIMLFSFENFSYFHKCLGYLLQNKTIDEKYFQNFVELVQK